MKRTLALLLLGLGSSALAGGGAPQIPATADTFKDSAFCRTYGCVQAAQWPRFTATEQPMTYQVYTLKQLPHAEVGVYSAAGVIRGVQYQTLNLDGWAHEYVAAQALVQAAFPGLPFGVQSIEALMDDQAPALPALSWQGLPVQVSRQHQVIAPFGQLWLSGLSVGTTSPGHE